MRTLLPRVPLALCQGPKTPGQPGWGIVLPVLARAPNHCALVLLLALAQPSCSSSPPQFAQLQNGRSIAQCFSTF